MEREQIIKALECCVKSECNKCPLSDGRCANGEMGRLALTIIKELTEENERLTRHTKMHDEIVAETKSDTVRKMHSEIRKRCMKGCIYPVFVARTIDQIAKEMVENGNV